MRKPAALFLAFTLVTLASASSCERSTPSGPLQPSGPTLRYVEVIAPATLAPGASARLRLVEQWSDGTARDVSTAAEWHSDQPSVLAVAPDGLATALQAGEATVMAEHERRNSLRRTIVVVPDGTYRVTGRVVEHDTPEYGIAGARVEADGLGPALTDQQGGYRLYGVPGTGTMRVSKSGYLTTVHHLTIDNHSTQNFALALAAPRIDIAGTFQLTIEAAAACRTQLPDALLSRRYTAAITQTGARFQAEVSGASFATRRNRFSGSIQGAEVILDFAYDHFYYYYYGGVDFAELVDESTYFVVSGRALLSAVGRSFVGELNGMLWSLPSPGYRGPSGSTCQSSSHRLTLTR